MNHPLDSDGNTLWKDREGASLMREVFDYRHANDAERYGWRWRDVVEAYPFEGAPLWRHEGRWRAEEPGMGQFALSSDGTRMAVLTNGDGRRIHTHDSNVAHHRRVPDLPPGRDG